MSEWVVDHALQRVVQTGSLALQYPSGKAALYGDGSGEELSLEITDRQTVIRLARNPTLALGEAYMDETLIVREGTIYGAVALLLGNLAKYENMALGSISLIVGYARKRIDQFNPLGRSKRNVAHHYDLHDDFYDLFLDADRQYSCAYFPHEGMSLEEAQEAKKQHIIAKLKLEPGQHVLDIGCGWGGMALALARAADVKVTGITLSEHQHRIARQRVQEAELEGRIDIQLADYRDMTDQFDRIVSVGMFEHVGVDQYQIFFRKIKQLLKADGIALLHSIGRAGPPVFTNPWMRKYIFPGGYIPAMSEVIPVVEKQNLWIGDIEILRTHYAETIRHWRERFMARRDEAVALYDERFSRMWEFYLASSEASFRVHNMMVFQMQLLGNQYAAPDTRDYMLEG